MYATAGGGYYNIANGAYSFAAGLRARANHTGTFVWADSSENAHFASTGNNQFLIRAVGGVGIGTNSPSNETKLHIQADTDDFGVLVDAEGTSGTQIGLHTANSKYASLVKNAYFPGGSWQRFDETSGAFLQEIMPTGDVKFRVTGTGSGNISWTDAMRINTNGNVGIGTNPSYKLDVTGDINVSGNIRKGGTAYTHPDYVFEPDYELMSLEDLKKYVSEKKCLPNVISAEHVKRNNGYNMDELLIQMLEKIEEQTLYIFQLEERIAALESEK
jgi:hypothetical protein